MPLLNRQRIDIQLILWLIVVFSVVFFVTHTAQFQPIFLITLIGMVFISPFYSMLFAILATKLADVRLTKPVCHPFMDSTVTSFIRFPNTIKIASGIWASFISLSKTYLRPSFFASRMTFETIAHLLSHPIRNNLVVLSKTLTRTITASLLYSGRRSIECRFANWADRSHRYCIYSISYMKNVVNALTPHYIPVGKTAS